MSFLNIEFGRPKIGLALGSGASRGWAHIGVIRALREAGIIVDVIAGTSAGAVVGAYHAAGVLDKLEHFAEKYDSALKTITYLDVNFGGGGLMEGKRFMQLVRRHLPVTEFEGLQFPFGVAAVDLATMREVIFTTGDLLTAIRATIAVPGFLAPVDYQEMKLVDGGILNPVPVNLARSLGASVVIAVDLNRELLVPDLASISGVLNRSIEAMIHRIGELNHRVCPADFTLTPHVKDFAFMDFHRSAEAIRIGYNETREKIGDIKKILNRTVHRKLSGGVIVKTPALFDRRKERENII